VKEKKEKENKGGVPNKKIAIEEREKDLTKKTQNRKRGVRKNR